MVKIKKLTKIIAMILAICMLSGCSIFWRASQSPEYGQYDNCSTIVAPAALDGLALMGTLASLMVLNNNIYNNLSETQREKHPIPLYNSIGLTLVILSGIGLYVAHTNNQVCKIEEENF